MIHRYFAERIFAPPPPPEPSSLVGDGLAGEGGVNGQEAAHHVHGPCRRRNPLAGILIFHQGQGEVSSRLLLKRLLAEDNFQPSKSRRLGPKKNRTKYNWGPYKILRKNWRLQRGKSVCSLPPRCLTSTHNSPSTHPPPPLYTHTHTLTHTSHWGAGSTAAARRWLSSCGVTSELSAAATGGGDKRMRKTRNTMNKIIGGN